MPFQLTLGTCLPGFYSLKFSVKNSAGLSASDFLLIFVERYSINIFTYSFSPPNATDFTRVTQLSSDLLINSSMVTSLAVQQLPAFGVDSASIRSVEAANTSVHAGAIVNGQISYTVNIQLAVVLVSKSALGEQRRGSLLEALLTSCLLYTSDAADE